MTTPNSSERPRQSTTPSVRESAKIALSDPLKAETRKARLYLLGVSMVGISIVRTGLVPQEISTLGITFGDADQRSLLVILSFVVLYYLVTFAVYGVSDFLRWRYGYSDVHWAELRAEEQRRDDEVRERHDEIRQRELEMQEREDEHKRRFEEITQRYNELKHRTDESLRKLSPDSTENRGDALTPELEAKRQEILETQRQEMEAIDADRLQLVQHRGYARLLAKSVYDELYGESPVEPPASIVRALARYTALAPIVAWVRTIIEFVVPLVVGIGAIVMLLAA
jgi:hypothetical protein